METEVNGIESCPIAAPAMANSVAGEGRERQEEIVMTNLNRTSTPSEREANWAGPEQTEEHAVERCGVQSVTDPALI